METLHVITLVIAVIAVGCLVGYSIATIKFFISMKRS